MLEGREFGGADKARIFIKASGKNPLSGGKCSNDTLREHKE